MIVILFISGFSNFIMNFESNHCSKQDECHDNWIIRGSIGNLGPRTDNPFPYRNFNDL